MNLKAKEMFTRNRIIGLSLVIVFVVGLIIGGVVISAPASRDLYLDNLVSSETYVVEKIGTTFYSTRYDGYIAFSGTDADSVVQSTVDACTSGGKIFFKTGQYDFNTQVNVPYSIIFDGEGPTHTHIRCTADVWLFNITADDVCFRNIYFNGNSKTGNGLRFGAGSNFAKVEFCRFYNFKTAIVAWGNGGSNKVGRIADSKFGTCDYGIKVNADAGYWATDWVITTNHMQSCGTQAIQVTGDGSVSGIRVIANTIEDSPTGVRLGNNSNYARVHYNRFENCTSYGIYVLNTPSNVHITHNYLATANITISSVGNAVIRDNDGNQDYVTLHQYGGGTSFPTTPTPIEGELFYRTDTNTLYAYDGATWNNVSGAVGPAGPTGPAGNMNNTHLGYKYIVYGNNTGAYMVDGQTATLLDWSTDCDSVLQWSIHESNLTTGRDYQERVLWTGNFSIDDTIYFYNYTRVDATGQFWLEPNSDCDMFRNSNYGAGCIYGFTLHGGVYYGDRDQNSPSNCFRFYMTTYQDYKRLPSVGLYDLSIYAFQDWGIYWDDDTGGNRIDVDIYMALYCYDGAFYAEGLWDSNIKIKYVNSASDASGRRAIYLKSCGTTKISGFYSAVAWHAVYLQNCFHIGVYDALIDNCKGEPIIIEGSRACRFDNIEITAKDGTMPGDNTINGIVLRSSASYDSTNNLFTNIFIGRPFSNMRGSERYKYGIYETDVSQDQNGYSCINVLDSATAGIYLTGPNSETSVIIGTVV